MAVNGLPLGKTKCAERSTTSENNALLSVTRMNLTEVDEVDVARRFEHRSVVRLCRQNPVRILHELHSFRFAVHHNNRVDSSGVSQPDKVVLGRVVDQLEEP